MLYVVAVIKTDNNVLALLSTDAIVQITEMFDIDGELVPTPEEAVSAVAGPVRQAGKERWIAFEMPGRHTVH